MLEELYFILSACVVVGRKEPGHWHRTYIPDQSPTPPHFQPRRPHCDSLGTPHDPKNRSKIHQLRIDEQCTQTRTTSEYGGVLDPFVQIRDSRLQNDRRVLKKIGYNFFVYSVTYV